MTLSLEAPGRPWPQAPDSDMRQPMPRALADVNEPLPTRVASSDQPSPPPASLSMPLRAIHGAAPTLQMPQIQNLCALLDFGPPRHGGCPLAPPLSPPGARSWGSTCPPHQEQLPHLPCSRVCSLGDPPAPHFHPAHSHLIPFAPCRECSHRLCT